VVEGADEICVWAGEDATLTWSIFFGSSDVMCIDLASRQNACSWRIEGTVLATALWTERYTR